MIFYRLLRLWIIVFLLCAPCAAFAQQMVLGGKIQINPDQKLMFQAAKQVMSQDYKGAEATYSQVLAMNSNNTEAYLQRGVIRREMGDTAGTLSDGHAVVAMANTAIQANPNDPNLYYQRGMGWRLLRNYDQAKNDIRKALELSRGNALWQTDLQAVDLEQKEGR